MRVRAAHSVEGSGAWLCASQPGKTVRFFIYDVSTPPLYVHGSSPRAPCRTALSLAHCSSLRHSGSFGGAVGADVQPADAPCTHHSYCLAVATSVLVVETLSWGYRCSESLVVISLRCRLVAPRSLCRKKKVKGQVLGTGRGGVRQEQGL